MIGGKGTQKKPEDIILFKQTMKLSVTARRVS